MLNKTRKNATFSRNAPFSTIFQLLNLFIFLLGFVENQVTSLTELAAKCVASSIPFELVEDVYPPMPEQLQLRIAYWSFPDNEEDIRLYSCLANGSADEFYRGDQLYRNRSVKEPLQIGMCEKLIIIVSSRLPQNTCFYIKTSNIRRIPLVSNGKSTTTT